MQLVTRASPMDPLTLAELTLPPGVMEKLADTPPCRLGFRDSAES